MSDWHVDRFAAFLAGQALRSVALHPSEHPLNGSRWERIWMEIVFVSICHQANWDELHEHILGIAKKDFGRILPGRLAALSEEEFQDEFTSGFAAKRLRMKERLFLLNDLGASFHKYPNLTEWLSKFEVTLGGEAGMYAVLQKSKAFASDPVQKKSRVLIHQLLRYGLVDVLDPKEIRPAVDYHLIRLYVRTGRVVAHSTDSEIRMSSTTTARVEFLTKLREAVEEAMYYTAAGAGLRIDELNHIEWQIGRSFCTREVARCHGGPDPNKDMDLAMRKLARRCNDECPLIAECRGATDETLRSLQDPRSTKAYY